MSSKMELSFVLIVILAVGMFFITILALVEHMKDYQRLQAIYIISENNAQENEIAWTIMDIIKGEENDG